MEPGPLPPHERSWRHPSELGPTRLDVDTGSRSGVGVLAVGALAVFAVAAMVVVMTPRSFTAPVAISVTTVPMRTTAVVSDVGAARSLASASNGPNAARSSANALMTTFDVSPHAISSAPQPDLDNSHVADQRPDNRDMVLVRTEDVTYRLEWGSVPLIDVADGSVVFDASGDIVARVSGGELRVVVDD